MTISSNSVPIVVITYNIRHGLGMDGKVDLARIAHVLRAQNPDIVCLQEVESRSPRTGWVNQARWIARELGMKYVFGPNLHFGPLLRFGNAILTKAPVYSTWNKFLPSSGERRGLLYAQIRWKERPLHLFCTHWGLTSEQRMRQAETCSGETAKVASGEPIILCGDLNAPPGAPEIQRLIQQSGLCLAGDTDMSTFPSDQPQSRIDYVFVSDGLVCDESEAVASVASDHLPFAAIIKSAP